MPRKNGPLLLASGYKYCFTCREAKAVAEFYRNRSNSDGLTSQCKPCARATSKRVRERQTALREFFSRSPDGEGEAGPRLIDLVGLDVGLAA